MNRVQQDARDEAVLVNRLGVLALGRLNPHLR